MLQPLPPALKKRKTTARNNKNEKKSINGTKTPKLIKRNE